jgi:hypothetical protein
MDGERVLVVFEAVRSGAATLELARDLVEREHAILTVVSVAPQGMTGARCGNSARDYNLAVQDSVAGDLGHARAWLEEFGVRASYTLLLDGVPPSLDEFATAGCFDFVLLPARHWPMRGHPAAARLRRATGAQIQVVARRPQQRAHGSSRPVQPGRYYRRCESVMALSVSIRRRSRRGTRRCSRRQVCPRTLTKYR